MGDLFALLLFLLWWPQLRRNIRIGAAKDANDRARDALNAWLDTHQECSLQHPRAQALIGERLAAWKAYVKECPVLDDGGVMERYLEACLEDDCAASSECPMP